MSLKAKLSITLKADDVVIAETEDTRLWLKILTSVTEASLAQTAPQGEHEQHEHHNDHQHNQGGVSA